MSETGDISEYKNYGSTGVGCTLNKWVNATVSTTKTGRITFNGKEVQFPTVKLAINQITKIPLLISIKSELPLGCGFGISGAASLSALFAVSKLLKLNIPKYRLYEIAHYAEIKEKTGLGTVATQITGGMLIKNKAGIPPLYEKLNLTGVKIYATVTGQLATPEILSDGNKIRKINREANIALKELKKQKQITLAKILNISYKFCKNSGLISSENIKKIIEQIRKSGGAATMAILGETVLSDIKPEQSKYQTFELTISKNSVEKLI